MGGSGALRVPFPRQTPQAYEADPPLSGCRNRRLCLVSQLLSGSLGTGSARAHLSLAAAAEEKRQLLSLTPALGIFSSSRSGKGSTDLKPKDRLIENPTKLTPEGNVPGHRVSPTGEEPPVKPLGGAGSVVSNIAQRTHALNSCSLCRLRSDARVKASKGR